jgi:hypothetical protein
MGLHLITFGGGRLDWRRAAKRLAGEASDSGWFESITCVTDRSLVRSFPDFGALVTKETLKARGFGYWVWKPFLVTQTLRRLGPGDVLLYTDAGCHLNVNPQSQRRLSEYVHMTLESGGLVMQIRDATEIEWTKSKVLHALRVPPEHRESDQIAAGTFLLERNPENLLICGEWLRLALAEDFSLVDDTLGEDESPRLRAHRHDQSIWSCLVKKTALAKIVDETYWWPDWWGDGRAFPLWLMRHRSGTDPAGHSVWDKAVRKAEQMGTRLRL